MRLDEIASVGTATSRNTFYALYFRRIIGEDGWEVIASARNSAWGEAVVDWSMNSELFFPPDRLRTYKREFLFELAWE